MFHYSAVIRTLGNGGEKYQALLNSLANQTVLPQKIVVYIAEGYPIPKETMGAEQYVYVKKGMVAQRALDYKEVESEYILFLDDDVYLPPNATELLFSSLAEKGADVISPDVFDNASRSFSQGLLMLISGRMRARKDDKHWGYKVMRNSGYSYNRNPSQDIYYSQTNAGPCFFCSKEIFLNAKFEDELWLDKMDYPLGEDQVMYDQMSLNGYEILTLFNSAIIHLDAGSSRVNSEKENKIIYSDFRFKTIFWHRFIYKTEERLLLKLCDVVSITYTLLFTLFVSLLKLNFKTLKVKYRAIKDSFHFINSDEYKTLTPIKKYR